jgi:GDP-L-fucose synthase
MIRKCVRAKLRGERAIELWGDGSPTREFLYVEDCARGLVLAAERYDDSAPVNLGAGFEISMRDLAARIAELCGYAGELRWNPERPNGQPRRSLDVSRARERFGFSAEVPFEEGLRRTIAWYREHGAQEDEA